MTSQFRLLIPLLFALSTLGGSQLSTREAQGLRVNIFQLLANPERFDGRTVRTIGYLTMGHESDFLYAYETDAVNLLPNRIGIEISDSSHALAPCKNGNYVVLVATFKKAKEDQVVKGIFRDVKRCQIWSDPAKPLSQVLREMPGAAKQ